MKYIYTLTVFHVIDSEHPELRQIEDQRTWGWYPSREQAEERLSDENNDNYFEDGYYKYALIEEVPRGLMGGAGERKTWWFRADYGRNKDGCFYSITPLPEAPEFALRIVNFSMG